MALHTFLWHDYETFGLNPRRERPSQFPGIRTNAKLKEIDKLYMLTVEKSSTAEKRLHQQIKAVKQFLKARHHVFSQVLDTVLVQGTS